MDRTENRPVTMAQVAADAGVSIPTVSRVVTGSAPVAEDTRRAVRRSIETLGYQPNLIARGLSRGRSDSVLVILPHITEPSSSLRLSGLIDVLRRSPYELHLVDLERPLEDRVRPIGEIVLQNRPAGVVIISLPTDEQDHHRFEQVGAPVVLIDSPSPQYPSDVVDDVAGGALAVNHLIALGHTRIGFIGDREDTAIGVPSSANRRRGYEQALLSAQLQIRSDYIGTAPHGTETAEMRATEMLALTDPPTAIFAVSDVQAFGVLSAARKANVRVPHELSVVGFDDIQAASMMALTTVRQPLEISGRRAGIQLLKLLGHPSTMDLPEFPALELVVRDTTAPVVLTTRDSLLDNPKEGPSSATKIPSVLDPAIKQGGPVSRRK